MQMTAERRRRKVGGGEGGCRERVLDNKYEAGGDNQNEIDREWAVNDDKTKTCTTNRLVDGEIMGSKNVQISILQNKMNEEAEYMVVVLGGTAIECVK